MFHPLTEVPEKEQRKAKNNGYWDKPVGWLESPGGVSVIAYRRIWIEPKYYSEHVKYGKSKT